MRVRVLGGDPAGHIRLPRYLRGQVGRVVGLQGSWPVPDRLLRAGDDCPIPTYSVEFDATDVFGTGDHVILADIWEHHLEEAPPYE